METGSDHIMMYPPQDNRLLDDDEELQTQGTTNPIAIDCSGIVDQVMAIVSEQNKAELEKIQHTLNSQREHMDKVVANMNNLIQNVTKQISGPNFPEGNRPVIIASPNVPDGTQAVGNSSTIVTNKRRHVGKSPNALDGALAKNGTETTSSHQKTSFDGVSITGSNLWFRSLVQPSSEGDDEDKENSTVKGLDPKDTSQEYWHKSTTDYEEDNKASGPEISSSVACAAKVFWQKRLKGEAFKRKIDEAATPSNCGFLLPKRTNTEIWKTLSSYHRTTDIKMQEIQSTHAASVTMMLRASSDLVESARETNVDVKEPLN